MIPTPSFAYNSSVLIHDCNVRVRGYAQSLLNDIGNRRPEAKDIHQSFIPVAHSLGEGLPFTQALPEARLKRAENNRHQDKKNQNPLFSSNFFLLPFSIIRIMTSQPLWPPEGRDETRKEERENERGEIYRSERERKPKKEGTDTVNSSSAGFKKKAEYK